jgi:hypothetical protein
MKTPFVGANENYHWIKIDDCRLLAGCTFCQGFACVADNLCSSEIHSIRKLKLAFKLYLLTYIHT